MAPQSRNRPALQLQFPQSLGTYDDYAQAQKVVDFLSDEEFPVENCMIVGTELKQVERVTGRLTYGRAAAAGAASGAWFGLLIGLIFGLFAEQGNWIATVAGALLIGLLFGLVWGVIGYALTGGRRDFTSVSQVVATKYEVLVEHKYLANAQEILNRMPGRNVGF
ncbi:MAG: general stress protein [Nocardioidaceae bacterium]